MNVESCSNTNHEFGFEPRQVRGHETLLLGCAQANPKDIRFESCDELLQLFFFLGIEIPKWGRTTTHDLDTRKFCG